MGEHVQYDEEVPGWGRAAPQRLVLTEEGLQYGGDSVRWQDVDGIGMLQVLQRVNGIAMSGQQYCGIRSTGRLLTIRQSAAAENLTRNTATRAQAVARCWEVLLQAVDTYVLPRLVEECVDRIRRGDTVSIGGAPLIKPQKGPAMYPKALAAGPSGIAAPGLFGSKSASWTEITGTAITKGRVLLLKDPQRKPMAKVWMNQDNAMVLPGVVSQLAR